MAWMWECECVCVCVFSLRDLCLKCEAYLCEYKTIFLRFRHIRVFHFVIVHILWIHTAEDQLSSSKYALSLGHFIVSVFINCVLSIEMNCFHFRWWSRPTISHVCMHAFVYVRESMYFTSCPIVDVNVQATSLVCVCLCACTRTIIYTHVVSYFFPIHQLFFSSNHRFCLPLDSSRFYTHWSRIVYTFAVLRAVCVKCEVLSRWIKCGI